MSSNDDSRETASVFNDGNWVYFFQSFIHDTSAADVRESLTLWIVCEIIFISVYGK